MEWTQDAASCAGMADLFFTLLSPSHPLPLPSSSLSAGSHLVQRQDYIDVATGSLGQGLSIAAGMAYNGKYWDNARSVHTPHTRVCTHAGRQTDTHTPHTQTDTHTPHRQTRTHHTHIQTDTHTPHTHTHRTHRQTHSRAHTHFKLSSFQ